MTDVLIPNARGSDAAVASTSLPSTNHHGFAHAPTTGMLLPLRIFLAAGWLRAGAEKLIDPRWWSGDKLRTFLQDQHGEALPFFRPVMDHMIAPAAMFVALTVMVTQLACGVLIGTGQKLPLALRWAFFMNVTFVLAGRVNPSAFYLVMELVLLFAIADGALGVNPTTPSHRTFVIAGTSAVLGILCVPYIRTIEPAHVIDDPAMMLMFVGLMTATTLVIRWSAHPAYRPTRLGQLWMQRVSGWAHAKPVALAQAAGAYTDVPVEDRRPHVTLLASPWSAPQSSARSMS
jgi:uncharacterized membrane protein YphA (DoxX/SURF4 family)